MATTKLEAAAIVTLLDTELNSLASGSAVSDSSSYDNGTNLYIWGDFELTCTFGTAPTAGAVVGLYLIPAEDGTNYADYTDGATPVEASGTFAGGFTVRAVTTAQRMVLRGLPLPPVLFKAHILNNGGQALAASGNTLKMVPTRLQSA